MAKHSMIIRITKEGKVSSPAVLRALFESLKPGDKYLLTLDNSKKRSLPQNKFYWSVVIPVVQAGIKDLGTDLSKEETHDLLKSRCNYTELVNTDTGQCERLPRSTTALSTVEFMGYLERIQLFAIEFLSISIPNPNEEYFLNIDSPCT